MTHREAMLLLIDRTSHSVEAAKIIRAIDSDVPTAQGRAEKLIRIVLQEINALTDSDCASLRSLLPNESSNDEQQRTETVRFRCTPNERNALELLAAKYTGGNMSRLILDALQRAYPTL